MSDDLTLLIVSYAYPRPGTSWGGAVGGERMHQFARRLPAHAIEPIVLTHAGLDAGWLDGHLYASRDLVRSAVEWASHPQRRAVAPTRPREGWRVSDLRTSLRRWALPDRASYAWAPFAIAAASELASRRVPDVVLSSSPPMAAHVVGCWLAKRWNVPWIADVRDGYSFEPPEGRVVVAPLRRALERQLYAHAARVITVTDALRDDLRALLPDQRESILTITNGYDEALFSASEPSPQAGPPWDVVYAGSASFGAGRNLDRLLDGVDRFAVGAECDVRLRLIGLFAPHEIARPLSSARLDIPGWQTRFVVAQSLQKAGALVVLTGNHSTVATTKVFEYIGAGRPILVVGRESAAARIVVENDFGIAVDDAPDQIAHALERIYRDRVEWSVRLESPAMQRARAAFSRNVQAQQLARLVREVAK